MEPASHRSNTEQGTYGSLLRKWFTRMARISVGVTVGAFFFSVLIVCFGTGTLVEEACAEILAFISLSTLLLSLSFGLILLPLIGYWEQWRIRASCRPRP